ncbi:tRNA(adenine34) deaminase [Flavobacterium phragmitis]|uniref:tRNA-specific adenosine deaminase n=2 Tax=Flavobacterium phragmitis TaxID=739143 RepID=A0A1I1R460_9FLAO|nr:tRNA(adenine34) deaminase [Flavobacterium phragmitis]
MTFFEAINFDILKKSFQNPIFATMINPFTDEYFMKKALQEAEMAFEKGEIPVGAIIVVADKVIARSHNLTELLNDVTAHAEMQSITAAANFLGGKYLKDCTLYVTLEPCQMCAGALYWSQISKIVFGARDEQRGFINMGTKLHPKTTVVSGVMANEAADLMKRFFLERRK